MAIRLTRGALVFACAFASFGSAPAMAQQDDIAGAYLAARAAGASNDFDAASEWFIRALEHDPANPGLIDNCLLALVGLGDLQRASGIAQQAVANNVNSELANMVLLASSVDEDNWDAVITQLDAGHSVGDRVDMLARAWALVGKGDFDEALVAFDATSQLAGSRGFGTYHKAMALGVMGRMGDAAELLALPPDQGVPLTRRAVIARIQILSSLGKNDEALEVLDAAFGRQIDPSILALRQAVATGGIVPFDIVGSPAEGIAEVFYTEGGAYRDGSPPAIVLLYAQIAQQLHGDDPEIIMMAAGLLGELERFEQAARTFALVGRDNPAYHSAEFGRADALHKAGEADLAIEVLQSMLRGYPLLAMAHSELGDIQRMQGDMNGAHVAYTDALDLIPPSDRRHWLLRYKRGIVNHQLDDWPSAEADFRVALDLNPGHAGLLNYLGYSLVERGEHLEEALDMIVRAIASEPDNGAIVDSYGWALYSLGRFDEAVEPMERAAQLLPEDPVINDHLGDVYWSVGRYREAQFQWNRALSFATDDEMATVIREKLENGLDLAMTTAEEGDLTVAHEL